MSRIQALYDFEPANKDELPFHAGDLLYVLKRQQGWYIATDDPEGRSQSGLVPANYFEELDDSDLDSIEADESASQFNGPSYHRRPSYASTTSSASRKVSSQHSDEQVILLGTVLEPVNGGNLMLAVDIDDLVIIDEVLPRRNMVRARPASGGNASGLIRWSNLYVWHVDTQDEINDINDAAEIIADGVSQDVQSSSPLSPRRPYQKGSPQSLSRDSAHAGSPSPPSIRRQLSPSRTRRKSPSRPNSTTSSDSGFTRRTPYSQTVPSNSRVMNTPSLRRNPSSPTASTMPRSRSNSTVSNNSPATMPRSRSYSAVSNNSPATMPRSRSYSAVTSSSITRTGSNSTVSSMTRTRSNSSITLGRNGSTRDVPNYATLTRAVPTSAMDPSADYSSLRRPMGPSGDQFSVGKSSNSTPPPSAQVSEIALVKGARVGPATYQYVLRVKTKAGQILDVSRNESEFYDFLTKLPPGPSVPDLPPPITVGAENNYKQCMVLPAVIAQRQKEFTGFVKVMVDMNPTLVSEFLGLAGAA